MVRGAIAAGLLLALVVVSLSAQTVDVLNGMVACWDLSEADGVRYDYWINDLNLTDNNTVGSVPGHVNALAADFTPANSEYLDHVDYDGLDIDHTLSIVAWASNDNVGSGIMNVVAKYPWGGVREYQLAFDTSNRVLWRVRDGASHGTIYWGSTVTNTTWYMLDAYHNNDDETVGLAVDNGTHVTGSNFQTAADVADFDVGTRAGLEFWDGQIGPLMVWDRMLAQSDRDYLWNNGNGRSCREITGVTEDVYDTQAVTLPSGRTGAIEMRTDVGEIVIASLVAIAVALLLFAIVAERVKATRASDT
jgi:hypothetical protein